MQRLKNLRVCDYILIAMLCVLILSITYINFLKYPSLYNFDMYSDIHYAMEAWKHHSVIPEDWVFGNQIYIAATPVLAALFYGIISDPLTAMGLASTVMSLLVIVSFYWMIKPCFAELSPRLFACIVLVLLPLFFGDAVYAFNGWQLLYTMCSYYACYAITAFWAFGLYIRNENLEYVGNWGSLLLLCCFSFLMGMQSLRQTAVMALPLIAMESIRIILSCVRKKKLCNASVWIALLVAVSNLLGVVFGKNLLISSSPILGEFKLTGLSASSLLASFRTLTQLFYSGSRFLYVMLLCICGFGIMMYHCRKGRTSCGVLLFGVFLLSVSAIGMIDVLSTMEVRYIYYFMAYPMVAYLSAWLFTIPHKIGNNVIRALMIAVVILVMVPTWRGRVASVIEQLDMHEEQSYEAVCDYLTESGYQTVLAGTDLGYKLGVASDMELQIGFWFTAKPFCEVRYLCNPNVFDVEPEACVYAFQGRGRVADAQEKLNENGLHMELLQYFPECDVYVFTSNHRLVELIE